MILQVAAATAAAGALFCAFAIETSLQEPPDLEAACDAGTPYQVTSCFRGLNGVSSVFPFEKDAPSVVLFSDTPDDDPYYVAATLEQVGAIWGLAYESAVPAVYAAAFHKTQLPLGPGGPGAIYKIDLVSGDIAHFVTVPNAGPDRHESQIRWDAEGEEWAGRSALGDLEINALETELHVVNLSDRMIYRFELPSGRLLGSFAHGAAGEPWFEEARPFALAEDDGYLYHGVVRTGEISEDASKLVARVYRSLPDGRAMEQVAAFQLDYDRGRFLIDGAPPKNMDWQPWHDHYYDTNSGLPFSLAPMPLLTDIEFDDEGNSAIGIRDRFIDASRQYYKYRGSMWDKARIGAGVGDLLQGRVSDGMWVVDTPSDHFQVTDGLFGEMTALGGLATQDGGEILISGSHVGQEFRGDLVGRRGEGAYWYDSDSGRLLQHESICGPGAAEPLDDLSIVSKAALAHCPGEQFRDIEARSPGTIGDIEVLCREHVAPTVTPTYTLAPPTSTATAATPPTATPTLVPSPTIKPTPTATPVPVPLYLPVALREHCSPEYYRSDIALVIDTSSSMTGQKIEDARVAALAFVSMIDLAPGRSQVTVVRYDREAEVVRELTRARATLDAAIRSLRVRSGTHIDKGLRAGLSELQSARHMERNTQVLVLLTDGVQTGTPGEELRAAAEVREAGVRVYAIALGGDADEATLRQIAGADERYFYAPDSGDLARIYSEIAVDLMCPDTWATRQ